MKCPYCNHDETKVMETRESENTTRRRRECIKCKKRFTTYERVENIRLIVVKKNGEREQFDRQKLEKGILKACEKREVSYDKIKKAVDNIEGALRNRKSTEVKSSDIGNLVIKKLKLLDKVAYIRFASVYKEFKEPGDFKKEVRDLLRKKS